MSAQPANSELPAALTDLWKKEGWWPAETLSEQFDRAERDHPDAWLRVVSGQRPAELDIAAFNYLSRRAAGGLVRLGIGPGDVVAVQCPNWVEGMAMLAGALRIGAVITPIVHIYGPAELGYILRQSGARVLLTPDRFRGHDYRDALADLVADMPNLCWVVAGEKGPAALAFDDLVKADPWRGAAPADLAGQALLIYTSGTSAAPKGVLHSHQTLGAELLSWTELRGRIAPILSPWPIGHVAGLLGFLRFAALGLSTVTMDIWDGEAAARLVAEHGILATSGTPLHIGSLLDASDGKGIDLSSLVDFQAGATVIPESVVGRAEAHGLHSYRCYGSSEHPTVSSGLPSDPLAKRLATDGRPNPGVEVRVVDEDGRDVPAGHEGEIATRGPDRFIGYQDPVMNAAAFLPGGWYLTGDIGRVDEEGFLAITDRKKDIIIRGGENISSREVEDHLFAHDAVSECAVVGLPHERLGEIVCACIVARQQALSKAELLAWFASRGVARQKTPEQFFLFDALPKNAAGKILKTEIKQRICEGEPTARALD